MLLVCVNTVGITRNTAPIRRVSRLALLLPLLLLLLLLPLLLLPLLLLLLPVLLLLLERERRDEGFSPLINRPHVTCTGGEMVEQTERVHEAKLYNRARRPTWGRGSWLYNFPQLGQPPSGKKRFHWVVFGNASPGLAPFPWD